MGWQSFVGQRFARMYDLGMRVYKHKGITLHVHMVHMCGYMCVYTEYPKEIEARKILSAK